MVDFNRSHTHTFVSKSRNIQANRAHYLCYCRYDIIAPSRLLIFIVAIWLYNLESLRLNNITFCCDTIAICLYIEKWQTNQAPAVSSQLTHRFLTVLEVSLSKLHLHGTVYQVRLLWADRPMTPNVSEDICNDSIAWLYRLTVYSARLLHFEILTTIIIRSHNDKPACIQCGQVDQFGVTILADVISVSFVARVARLPFMLHCCTAQPLTSQITTPITRWATVREKEYSIGTFRIFTSLRTATFHINSPFVRIVRWQPDRNCLACASRESSRWSADILQWTVDSEWIDDSATESEHTFSTLASSSSLVAPRRS